jgi:hypothetical protein
VRCREREKEKKSKRERGEGGGGGGCRILSLYSQHYYEYSILYDLEEDLKEVYSAQVVVGVFKVKLSILTIEYCRDNLKR